MKGAGESTRVLEWTREVTPAPRIRHGPPVPPPEDLNGGLCCPTFKPRLLKYMYTHQLQLIEDDFTCLVHR